MNLREVMKVETMNELIDSVYRELLAKAKTEEEREKILEYRCR